MRLTISLPELDRGVSIQGGPKDRQLDLAVMANRREPVAIRPVTNHDRRVISAILLTDAITSKSEIELKFRPIWSKVFTLCSSSKDKILALILETDQGQFWIDGDTTKPCKLTLAGNGTDPRIVEQSEYILGDLLTLDKRPDVVLNLIQFLQNHY